MTFWGRNEIAGPESYFPFGADAVEVSRTDSVPSLWNADPRRSELNTSSSEGNDANVGL